LIFFFASKGYYFFENMEKEQYPELNTQFLKRLQ